MRAIDALPQISASDLDSQVAKTLHGLDTPCLVTHYRRPLTVLVPWEHYETMVQNGKVVAAQTNIRPRAESRRNLVMIVMPEQIVAALNRYLYGQITLLERFLALQSSDDERPTVTARRKQLSLFQAAYRHLTIALNHHKIKQQKQQKEEA